MHYFFGWPNGAVWGNVIAMPLCALAAGLVIWWKTMCALPWCWRRGRHPVAKTTWRVCDGHHHVAHHITLLGRFRAQHPHRLGWGESHDVRRRR